MKSFFTFFGLVCVGVLLYLITHQISDGAPNSTKTETLVSEMAAALKNYKHDCGQFPAVPSWQKSLNEKMDCANWKGPYLTTAGFKDSWGFDFFYRNEGSSVTLGSYGEDGKIGGLGEASDISVEINGDW